MAGGLEQADQPAGRDLVMRRAFDAPRARVWKAWTEGDRAIEWWGPHGFRAGLCEWDLRPGGAWRAVMRSPEGVEYPQHGVLREMVPPERLVFSFIWDGDGPESETLVTVTLAERRRKTEMTFRKGPFRSETEREGEESGWNETFERLRAYVETR
jgi:uncharacterized protein YndB with AHSA1/START domain